MTFKDFIENQIDVEEYCFFSEIDGDDVYIHFSIEPEVYVKVMSKYEYENREVLPSDISELLVFACEAIYRL